MMNFLKVKIDRHTDTNLKIKYDYKEGIDKIKLISRERKMAATVKSLYIFFSYVYTSFAE